MTECRIKHCPYPVCAKEQASQPVTIEVKDGKADILYDCEEDLKRAKQAEVLSVRKIDTSGIVRLDFKKLYVPMTEFAIGGAIVGGVATLAYLLSQFSLDNEALAVFTLGGTGLGASTGVLLSYMFESYT